MSFFDDVVAFHAKFELDHPGVAPPSLPDLDTYFYRRNFLLEELFELERAHAAGNLSEFADALVDLIYVALGTASLAGLPFNEHWAEVQRANMTKERAASSSDPRSKRKHHLDVVKPAGWTAPNHEPILIEAMRRHGLVPPTA